MYRKVLKILVAAAALAGWMFVLDRGIDRAYAQEATPTPGGSCCTCHENQYYNYDTGKYYCLCSSSMCCTACHGGRIDSPLEEIAHEGMVANPILNDAAVCQDCHPDDYKERVQTFATVAGIHSTPHPCPTCTAAAAVPLTTGDEGGNRLFRMLPPGGWQIVGVGVFGIAFIALVWFGLRCCKQDRIEKLKGQNGEAQKI